MILLVFIALFKSLFLLVDLNQSTLITVGQDHALKQAYHSYLL